MPIEPKKLLTADRIIDLKSREKPDVLNELVDLLATSDLVTDKEELRKKIFEREEAVSTGVGAGMAIPHVKIPSIKNFVAAVGRCKEGIDFKSLDGKPTYIVVMIGCNAKQSADFLKVLARLAPRLKQPEIQKRILESDDPNEILEIFVGQEGVLT